MNCVNCCSQAFSPKRVIHYSKNVAYSDTTSAPINAELVDQVDKRMENTQTAAANKIHGFIDVVLIEILLIIIAHLSKN